MTASLLNAAVLIAVGLRPQLGDGPVIVAKDAANASQWKPLWQLTSAYHDAQFREQRLLMAGVLSVLLSLVVMTISIALVIRLGSAGRARSL